MADRELQQSARDASISSDSGLARVAFRPADGEDAYALWREATSPVFEVGARQPLPSFRAANEFYDVDGLIFCCVSFSATSYTREARHLRGGETDFITLQRPIRGGTQVGTVADEPFKMAADRILLQDWAHPYASVAQSAAQQFGVMIPRHRIVARDWVYERQPTMTWMLDSPQGQMLANAWITLWQSLPQASVEDAPTLAAGFLGLLNGLISPDPYGLQDAAVQPGMLPVMKHFLDSHLTEPDLGIEQLVQAFRCSRSTVYRLFRQHGGIHSYIRDRRLACCFRDLVHPSAKPRRIRNVAERWGFQDAHHFSRLFKQQFRITPSEAAVNAGHSTMDEVSSSSAPSHDDRIAQFHQWLKRG